MTTQYATYEYYVGTYFGTAIPLSEFNALALRASAALDRLTFDRAATVITDGTDATTVAAIQMAVCAMADELKVMSVEGYSGVKSESVGSHSVSYSEGAPATKSMMGRLATAASLYLGGTELLYRGFASGEYSTDRDEVLVEDED
jgi:hypothetical protein